MAALYVERWNMSNKIIADAYIILTVFHPIFATKDRYVRSTSFPHSRAPDMRSSTQDAPLYLGHKLIQGNRHIGELGEYLLIYRDQRGIQIHG